jgi:cell filamentation protein
MALPNSCRAEGGELGNEGGRYQKMPKRKTPSRYATVSQEMEFEPGSGDKVLRNKLGIKDAAKMHDEEIKRYREATMECFALYSKDHSFTVSDIYLIHEKIFGGLYEWGGKQRNVDISKGGFSFTRAIFLSEREKIFEKNVLAKLTPAEASSKKVLAKKLAVIHVELILLHPFREGNGRAVRLLLMLIAQQAGYRELNFDSIAEGTEGFTAHIDAIHAGQGGDYMPMTRIMERVIV